MNSQNSTHGERAEVSLSDVVKQGDKGEVKGLVARWLSTVARLRVGPAPLPVVEAPKEVQAPGQAPLFDQVVEIVADPGTADPELIRVLIDENADDLGNAPIEWVCPYCRRVNNWIVKPTDVGSQCYYCEWIWYLKDQPGEQYALEVASGERQPQMKLKAYDVNRQAKRILARTVATLEKAESLLSELKRLEIDQRGATSQNVHQSIEALEATTERLYLHARRSYSVYKQNLKSYR